MAALEVQVDIARGRYWPTEKIPIALHAANETGMYSEDAVTQLAKYDMVTIEKCVLVSNHRVLLG